MLPDIQKKLGIDSSTDTELEEMKGTLAIQLLQEKLNSIDETIYRYKT